ncbi:hypothetical protein J437_LFUL013770 [Ladona fulva]|uniref:PNK FHA domain-containing protein n=1 Tax=Ladona fulva TaxID=123851 RepID=A0A8K0KFT6_LADFU|nr:hypothetical protein J437_LFUL013770 [Ladona fulva]
MRITTKRSTMDLMKKCFLSCTANSHPPILIPHQKILNVGRSPDTKIIDKKCSRIQLSLKADYYKNEIEARHNGPNMSGVNGQPFKNDENCNYKTLKHGDILEILLGSAGSSKRPVSPADAEEDAKRIKRSKEEDNLMAAKKDAISSDGSHCSRPCVKSIWESLYSGKVSIFTSEGVIGREKIAAYDLDGTLITTKSGRVFPKDSNDWQIAYAEVPGKLKTLWENGYKIVIFTNQAGIESGRTRLEDFKTKVERIVKRLGVPIQVYVCIASGGLYRKPAIGMWQILSQKNGGVSLSENSKDHIYVGDAAGRGAGGKNDSKSPRGTKNKIKKDFSCSDRLFALNLGLQFFTPEEHFLNQAPRPYNLPELNPAALLVVMVGGPGSGKSYATKNYLKGYVRACRDELGTREKCEALARSQLLAGLSVVLDSTNPEKSSRARAISLARSAGVPVRCFLMSTSKELARHNNKFREITDPSHAKVAEMIINSYYAKYEEPSLDEGFDEIVKVEFTPKFEDLTHKKLYSMYLLDK